MTNCSYPQPSGRSLRVRRLKVAPHLHIPLHLHPHGKASDHDAKEVAQLAPGDPSVGDEHEMAELPEGVKEVGEPTLGHHWATIVVAARTVVDTADGGDAARTVLLPRVTEALDDLLVLRRIRHALPDVLGGFTRRLRWLELGLTEAWCIRGSHLAIAKGLLLDRCAHAERRIAATNRKACAC
eukprot:CAMPEP_0180777812 /NCGR_PEP_ID=MMETSP1038_2-20121128/45496_1 /TAXON_ID=632150 /ORGANISM="Azadinium spinosum, Strain 3D9" /LENGTH=182 /DNA_ID=CAMNT_0022812951 /DNA_START=15 /DNA_END=560 /DNA_ORIENTATION=-